MARCQSALKFDPGSACKVDPGRRAVHGVHRGPVHRGVTATSLTERCAAVPVGPEGEPRGEVRGGDQARFLTRQLSLPVSMMSQ